MGPNYQQLTVNAPRVEVHTTIQDGPMSFLLRSGDTNYEPSALAPRAATTPAVPATPPEALHDAFTKEESFYQAGEFYRALAPEARARLVKNFAGDLGVVRSDTVRATIVGNLRQADKEYGDQVAALVRVP